jgi:hypothetical protein
MKLAKDWIREHGQSGEYPKVNEPVGCFTEAQVRQIQADAQYPTDDQLDALFRAIEKDSDIAMARALAKAKEEGK